MASTRVGPDTAAAALLDALRPFLPAPVAGLPAPRLGFAELRERGVGIGNRRGSERRGGLGLAELKAIGLDAVVRFDVGAVDAAGAEVASADLGDRLLGARDALWAAGVHRLALSASPVATDLGAAGFRKTVDYAVLYEFRYADTDGALSLITSIPIHAERDEVGGPGAETTTVTDELVRWDDRSAPSLVVRGPVAIGALSLLGFLPGAAPTGAVTVTRTFDSAAGPPAAFGALLPFLVAVAGPVPPERHARLTLPTLTAFRDEFTTAGPPIALGDWDVDGVTDLYTPATLPIEPAIELRGPHDRLEIAYAGAALDRVGVLHLRTERGAVG